MKATLPNGTILEGSAQEIREALDCGGGAKACSCGSADLMQLVYWTCSEHGAQFRVRPILYNVPAAPPAYPTWPWPASPEYQPLTPWWLPQTWCGTDSVQGRNPDGIFGIQMMGPNAQQVCGTAASNAAMAAH